MVKNMGSSVRLFELKSQFYQLLSVSSFLICLDSLYLTCLICQTGDIRIVSTSKHFEDYLKKTHT